MPVLLLGMGVFAVVAGLVMIGFGIPINEFSFGNTLISAGTTAAVGGLIIIAVGIAVGQLRRIAAMLADTAQAGLGAHAGAQAPTTRFPLPPDEPEPAPVTRRGAGAGPAVATAPAAMQGANGSRPPYPAKAKERPAPDPFAVDPEPAAMGEHPDQFAPSLRNPDEAPLPVDDDISLSPRHPQGAPAPMSAVSLDRTSDSFDWRVPPAAPNAPAAPLRPQPANFDAMWPAEGRVEAKPGKAPSPGAPAAPGAAGRPQMPKETPRELPKELPKAATDAAKDAAKPRTVAILKSGVVDGMGYTLYVDGSIEAELPQGTLRFASINELRSHLEKNA